MPIYLARKERPKERSFLREFPPQSVLRIGALFSASTFPSGVFTPIIVIFFLAGSGCYEHTVPRDPVVIEDCGWRGDPPPERLTVQLGYPICSISESGRVKCWGVNDRGQLGYGHTETIGDDETPADVAPIELGGRATQIASYGLGTCALLEEGNVRCWGAADNGNLGYGNAELVGDDETPAEMGDVSVGGTVAQVTRGYEHTCVLLDDGRVRCWGMPDWLGIGRDDEIIGDDETPDTIEHVDVGRRVVGIEAGGHHTCAVLATEDVRCWGANGHGQLGIDNPRYTFNEYLGDDEPITSVGLVDVGEPVLQIAAGHSHTCVLLEGGRVRCWGDSEYGQLGYGNVETIGDDETPASAGDVNVGGTVSQISAGRYHTCALLETGAIRCWGSGRHGALGYGNEDDVGDDESPAQIGDVPLGCSAWSVSAGNFMTCALVRNGAIRCWGSNRAGNLGYGHTENIGDDETPASAGDVPVW